MPAVDAARAPRSSLMYLEGVTCVFHFGYENTLLAGPAAASDPLPELPLSCLPQACRRHGEVGE